LNKAAAADVDVDVERAVLEELLAVRKRPEGLSSVSMTSCRTVVDLIGEGDPLVAMTRLTHRILETIDLDDDAIRVTAAAYSLGLGSAGRTHLQRLNDFGVEYGYEARQSRRLSDEGVRELARLITTNWIVHAVPSVEVTVIQAADESLAVQISTHRQWYIGMRPLLIQAQDESGERRDWEPPPVLTERESPEESPRAFIASLERFIRVPAPAPGGAERMRLTWAGEIWPRFVVSVMGVLSDGALVSNQCVGNTLLLTFQRDHRATAHH
jgi:hypothetical protein